MSSIFWNGLISYYVLFGVLFIYSFVLLVSDWRRLGTDDFRNLQELDVQDFEQQLVGDQGK
jgi:hypothetical protein